MSGDGTGRDTEKKPGQHQHSPADQAEIAGLTPENRQGDSAPTDCDRQCEKPKRDLLDILNFLVLCAAFGAAAYAGFEAHRLANSTDTAITNASTDAEKQRNIATDTEKRQLRAYLTITDFGVVCPDCDDTALKADGPKIRNSIRFRVENDGLSPAQSETSRINWLPVPGKDAPIPANFQFPDSYSPGMRSRPDIGKDHHKDISGGIAAKDTKTFLSAGTDKAVNTLYIYGHVDYCDIFKEPHSTAFCFLYVRNAGLNLPICDRHNGEISPLQSKEYCKQ